MPYSKYNNSYKVLPLCHKCTKATKRPSNPHENHFAIQNDTKSFHQQNLQSERILNSTRKKKEIRIKRDTTVSQFITNLHYIKWIDNRKMIWLLTIYWIIIRSMKRSHQMKKMMQSYGGTWLFPCVSGSKENCKRNKTCKRGIIGNSNVNKVTRLAYHSEFVNLLKTIN